MTKITKTKKVMMVLVILSFALGMAGCWDTMDVGNTTFVLIIGIDTSDNPQYKYKVTFVIPKPVKVRNRSDELYTMPLTVEAESVSKAVERLQTRLSREIFLGHVRAVIIGEKAAQENFADLTSLVQKSPEIALRTRTMFVQGSEASDLLNTKPTMERSLSSELIGMVMAGNDLALVQNRNIQDLYSEMRANKGIVLAPRVVITENEGTKRISHDGGAVLKNWRMLGWLNEDEAQGANWLINGAKSVVVGETSRERYSYLVDRKSLKIEPSIKNGQLSFTVKVKTSGGVIEEQGTGDLSNLPNLKKVEQLFSGIIAEQISDAVHMSQKEFETDYLGFGKALKNSNPGYFKKIKWPKVYPNVPVKIEVEVRIPRFGIER